MQIFSSQLGTAMLLDTKPLVAGSMSCLRFEYTVGAYGMEDSGALRLAWRMVSDWQIPQFTCPEASGYTSVYTTAKVELSLSYERAVRPYTNSILVRVVRGSLKAGDTLTLTLGDRSLGGAGARVQSHMEKNHEFRMYTDATGSGVYKMVGEPLCVDIVAGYPKNMKVILPGSVNPGELFSPRVLFLDENGNPAIAPKDDLSCKWIHAKGDTLQHLPRALSFVSQDNSLCAQNVAVDKEGFFYLHVHSESEGISASSNPCLCSASKEKLFFADMHGQNANTLGTGTLDEYYTFARDIAGVSVAGWQGNDFEITKSTWEAVRNKTKQYHSEGSFVAFLGYEWSGATPQGGDYNVYFKNDSEQFYPSSNWLSEEDISEEQIATPLSALWERFKGREDVLCIPHVGGRCGNLAYLNEEFCPAIEVHSHHGIFDWFAKEAMKRRLKVGFVASSDDHSGRLGLFSPSCGKTLSGGFDVSSGYCGIFAESLEKTAVWNALKARHCFASTHNRFFLQTRIKDAVMGDETEDYSEKILQVVAASSSALDSVYVYNWEKKIAHIRLQKPAKNRVRIRWCGVVVGGKHKSCPWDGSVQVENARIIKAEEYAVDREDQGISFCASQFLTFSSSTSGDYDGLILELQAEEGALFRFCSQQGSCEVPLDDIRKETLIISFSKHVYVEFSMANEEILNGESCLQKCQIAQNIALPSIEEDAAFWVKVMDDAGNAAWSSPIFVATSAELVDRAEPNE